MAGKILEESLAINNVGLNGYIRVISAEGYSYRMLVQTFVELCSSAETIQDAVNNWINEHPEAVTTVEDGSITEVKLSASLQETLETLIKSVGGPNAAITAADMTDQNKIYVYTGSEAGYTYGNWYYFKDGAWVSGGVYNSTALETDTTLTVAGMAADAKATGDRITGLKNDLSEIDGYKLDALFTELDISEAQNLYNNETVTNGFIAANGNISASATYCYSEKIAVEEGKTYTFWVIYRGNIVSTNSRFTCAYDSDGNVVESAGSNSGISSYTVPSGITHIVLSVEQAIKHLFMVVEGTTQPTMLLPYELEHYIAKQSFVSDAIMSVIRGTEFFKQQISTADAGTEYILTNVANKKNCSYSFSGTFSSFTSLEIGHGKTESGANYLIIDGEKITSYKPDGTAYATYTHGLTITDFIHVSIKCADTKASRATVTIQTNGGYASIGNVIFFGCNGNIYFKCGQTTENAVFAYNIMDLRKDVFVFGDSYISLADDKRWTNYAIENADNNMLLCGFAGANAQDIYPSFTTLMSMKSPKYVCWFLGMNNPDSSSIADSNWVEKTSLVVAYCKANGIIPILATIPNTPSVRNTYKNAWVRASGERYVDFAKAVGAESAGSSWYTGMLSSDNVHPTAEGAKALWLRLRLDVPEIMERITT